jgi:negative regulator of sigma E activity
MRLSAAMDGAVTLAELEHVLDDVEQDPTLAHTWSRYHRIGEQLRAAHNAEDAPIGFDADSIAGRVAQAIASEAAHPAEKTKVGRPVGWALAASIALAAVVSVLAWQTIELAPSSSVEVATVEAPVSSAPAQATASNLLPLPPQSERIQRYLEQHHASQTAGAGAIPGILPWVRVVGFDATRP